ncbi:MAG: hypothetical protein M1834_007049 [Cirrosporium novae-zelandiae]|nr:MAG: hypothetical protein M1834_007049 [Cirrosporium novae-zelandiae]
MTTPSYPKFVSFGRVGIVYQISASIAVKRAFDNDSEDIQNKYHIFDMLENNLKCPHFQRHLRPTYYMTRGYEPYDDKWFGKDHGPIVVDLLQEMRFPELSDNDEIDIVIQKCWHGKYDSIQSLRNGVHQLGCKKLDQGSHIVGKRGI